MARVLVPKSNSLMSANGGIFYFQLLLHVVSAMEVFIRIERQRQVDLDLLQILILILLSSLVLVCRYSRTLGAGIFCFSQALLVVRDFPATANHQFLFFLSSVLIVLMGGELQYQKKHFIRLQVVLVLAAIFWSGVQKFWHAYYFTGVFFTYSILHSPRFERLFSLLSGDAAVVELRQNVLNSGVYHSDSLPLLLLSNSIWIIEILLPLLYLWKPARKLVTVFLLLFVVCLELGAREISFGMYIAAGLMLPESAQWLRRLLIVAGLFYVLILLSAFFRPLAYLH